MAAGTIESRLIISAADKTGVVIDALALKIEALEKKISGFEKASASASKGTGRNFEQAAQSAERFNKVLDTTVKKTREMERAAGAMNKLGAAMMLFGGSTAAHSVKSFAGASAVTYRSFDDLVRYQRAIMGISPDEQKPFISQALSMGSKTPYNDIQVLEAQLSLVQRGVNKDFVRPIVEVASQYAQAMNASLPEAAKTIEGIIFSTGKSVEDAESALKVAKSTVDRAVKLAKIGGLDDEDIRQLYKYGGQSGSVGGLSDGTFGAMAALMRRSNIRGDEAGVAIRAIAGRLVSPTTKALAAYNTMGIDVSKYMPAGTSMSADTVSQMVKQKFGKTLTRSQMAKLGGLFDDPDQIGSMESFSTGATDILKSSFLNKKGKLGVQDSQKLSKALNEYYRLSVSKFDSEGLLRAIIASNPSLAQANSIFGVQQGGRFMSIGGHLHEFEDYKKKLDTVPEGFAQSIGDERMGGFAGALTRAEGAVKNFETALGRAHDSIMTQGLDVFSNLVNAASKMPDELIRGATAVVAFTTAAVAAEGALKALAIAGMRPGGVGGSWGWLALATGLGWLWGEANAKVGPEGARHRAEFIPQNSEQMGALRARQEELQGRIDAVRKSSSSPEEFEGRSRILQSELNQIGARISEAMQGSAQITVKVETGADFRATVTGIVKEHLKGVNINASGVGSSGKTLPDPAAP